MRRRGRFVLASVIVLALGGAVVGCPAAHDGYPTTRCMVDSDCYKGETCVNMVCTGPDMSVPGDMTDPFVGIDFARTDLTGSDAGDPMDLSEVDQ